MYSKNQFPHISESFQYLNISVNIYLHYPAWDSSTTEPASASAMIVFTRMIG